MTSEVDGNEFFLDQYLDEQDKYDEEPEVSDKDEFYGEELHDLLGDKDFEQGLIELERLSKEYPQAGFSAGADIARKYLAKKKSLEPLAYISLLADEMYKVVGYWFDTKWLVTDYLEDKALESVVEVLAELTYKEDSLSVEDFVETYTLGYDLIDSIESLSKGEQETAYKVLRKKRLEVAYNGLNDAGITKDFVLKNTPYMVYGKVVRNDKVVGKRNRKVQVSDADAKIAIDSLGLQEGNNFVENVYANVYGVLVRTPQGETYRKVVERFNKELRARIKSNGDFSLKSVTKLSGRLTIYKTDNYWVVLGSRLVVFREFDGGYRRLVDKPFGDVRVKDIKDVTSAMH